MAKVDFEGPVRNLRGRVKHKEDEYYCIRNGVRIISHYPLKKNPKKISQHQRTLSSNFSQAVAQAKDDLANPERRAYWLQLFEEQKRTADKPYKILRNFVIASITRQMAQ